MFSNNFFISQPRGGLLPLRHFLDFLPSSTQADSKIVSSIVQKSLPQLFRLYSLLLCYLRVYLLNYWSTEITKYIRGLLIWSCSDICFNCVNNWNIWLQSELAMFTVWFPTIHFNVILVSSCLSYDVLIALVPVTYPANHYSRLYYFLNWIDTLKLYGSSFSLDYVVPKDFLRCNRYECTRVRIPHGFTKAVIDKMFVKWVMKVWRWLRNVERIKM
jgi:hypothetical protein